MKYRDRDYRHEKIDHEQDTNQQFMRFFMDLIKKHNGGDIIKSIAKEQKRMLEGLHPQDRDLVLIDDIIEKIHGDLLERYRWIFQKNLKKRNRKDFQKGSSAFGLIAQAGEHVQINDHDMGIFGYEHILPKEVQTILEEIYTWSERTLKKETMH